MDKEISARLERLERDLTVLQDREAIRDVLYRYCRAADRADAELFKGCYWQDGFDDHGFFGGNAWEFSDFVCPLLRVTTATTHSLSNPIIDLQGDKAYCETQADVLHRIMNEGRVVYEWAQCRYLDVFEKRNGEWRILVRTFIADGIFWLQMNGELMFARGFAPENMPMPGGRYPEDPVYNLRNLREMVRTRTPTSDFWSGLAAVGRKL